MVGGLGLGSALAPLGIPGSRSFATPGFTTYDETLAQSFGVNQADEAVRTVIEALAQSLGIEQTILVATVAATLDDIGVSPFAHPIRVQPAILEQTIGTNDALAVVRGVVMLETLGLALEAIPNHLFNFTLEERTRIASALLVGIPVDLISGVGVTLVDQAQLSLQIIEELGIEPVIVPMLIFNRSLAETIAIADNLSRFLGASLEQGLGAGSGISGIVSKDTVITQGIGLSEAVNPQLVLRVTTTENIGLDDVDALQMLFNPVLTEGIEITAAYLSPGGSITTWAMNTRTAAVTEYSNYAFNSFARVGGKYLGASSDGLYELLGDDDDGTDIVAQIKSGFAQWAGTRFTMFKGAYLGVRGEGDFILRLTTGEGQTYNYAVSTRDMRSTKVHMGKGLRARYFAFELISTGQDFDLESIEFVPLVAQRRV